MYIILRLYYLFEFLNDHILLVATLDYCRWRALFATADFLVYGHPIRNRVGHYVLVLWFLLSFFLLSIFLVLLSSIFFSSPILSRRRLDIYHTSTPGVALVRI